MFWRGAGSGADSGACLARSRFHCRGQATDASRYRSDEPLAAAFPNPESRHGHGCQPRLRRFPDGDPVAGFERERVAAKRRLSDEPQ